MDNYDVALIVHIRDRQYRAILDILASRKFFTQDEIEMLVLDVQMHMLVGIVSELDHALFLIADEPVSPNF